MENKQTVPEENAIVPATVTGLTATGATVSFGWKTEGQVPFADFAQVAGKPAVKVGDQFEVLVENLADEQAKVVLSKEKAERLRAWDAAVARLAKGSTVQGTVAARIPGGYLVDVGIPAFLPGSQSGVRRQDDPESIVGEALSFTVTEFHEKKMKVVLSRKAQAEQQAQARRQEVLAKVKEGAVLTGVVRTVADYGAFVELGGGVDGLVHVSQMSWERIGHPREVVRVGQEVQVQVLKYDAAAGKIGLGLRQLQENPWGKVEERFPVGAQVEGKVANLTDFGAFVALAPGVEGLIHVSEMAWSKVKHPSDVLKSGDTVKAQVLLVDTEARRISLGLKQLQANPWKQWAEQHPAGTKVHGKIRSITDFGLFVELEPGVEGLVHISELSWTEKVKHPGDLFKKDDEVDAVVLKVDLEDQRIGLGIKQLQDNPWQTFAQAHPVGSRLKGRVSKVLDFGAFVELAPGIEGLVHVSELREERVERPADVVKLNEEIEVQILEIDLNKRKVSLSVKALTALSREEYAAHMNAPEVKTTLGDLFKDQLTKK